MKSFYSVTTVILEYVFQRIMLLDKTFKSLLEERKNFNEVFEINTELPSPQVSGPSHEIKYIRLAEGITSCRQQ